jgi:hypothetical protein
MKRFIAISIGLLVGSLSLTCRVNAQSSTTTIDNTPKYPSICTFSQYRRGMVYGKPLPVINISGDPAVVVTDRNFTSTVVYYEESGNQAYVTEFDIGDGTIQAWRKIDELYRWMAEKNKPIETQVVETPGENTSTTINSEEE